jgi:L-ascorbate metabolism protein UlaG (beta-lactamase superfamily)
MALSRARPQGGWEDVLDILFMPLTHKYVGRTEPWGIPYVLALAGVLGGVVGCSESKEKMDVSVLKREAFAIRWLGTSGYDIRYGETAILIDPFLTRPGPMESVLLDIPLISNTPLIDRHIRRADCILISHSHYDHLMDAPYIAKRTGAMLFGSKTTYYISKKQKVDERQLQVFAHGDQIDVDGIQIKVVASHHAKVLGMIHNDGEIEEVLPELLPLMQSHYKMGGAYAFLLNIGGYKIFHSGSADFIPEHVEKMVGPVDMLIMGIAGWQNTPDYVETLLALTKPKFVVPTHHDNFFMPYEFGFTLIRDIFLDEFVAKVKSIDPEIDVARWSFFDWHRQAVGGQG